jgi:acyl carrier protein
VDLVSRVVGEFGIDVPDMELLSIGTVGELARFTEGELVE